MRKMRRQIAIFAGMFFLSAGAAYGADAEAGKARAAQVCVACHGADGNKPSAPDQPILAGQHPDYLVKALSDYKSGKRQNPIMKGFASTLSKKDMEDLAAWFSSQKSALHDQR
jgi:cytochrome c553